MDTFGAGRFCVVVLLSFGFLAWKIDWFFIFPTLMFAFGIAVLFAGANQMAQADRDRERSTKRRRNRHG